MSRPRTSGATPSEPADNRLWRSVEERAAPPSDDGVEFPPASELPPVDVTRRGFMTLLGASAALAGCTRAPRERILPYTRHPPDVTPGETRFYATTFLQDGYGIGVLAESYAGRPIKVEGHPNHPASLGAAGTLQQATVLQLYDPDRSRAVRHAGQISTWESAWEALGGRRGNTHVLMPPVTSPHLTHLIQRVREQDRNVRFHFHAPLTRENVWTATQGLYGKPYELLHDLRAAKVIVSLDADLIHTHPMHLAYARQFADGRRLRSSGDGMNRLYVAEPALTVSGMNADHHLPTPRGVIPSLAAALLREVVKEAHASVPEAVLQVVERTARVRKVPEHWVGAVAKDLVQHRGNVLVAAGPAQPPGVHVMAQVINHVLDSVGRTVHAIENPVLDAGSKDHGLRALADALAADDVDTLLMLEGNPAYTAPSDLPIGATLRRARQSFHLSLYFDETSAQSTWHLPAAHVLEAWGDARAFDGTSSIIQPLISPLYDGRTAAQMLAGLLGRRASAHDLLMEHWRQERGDVGFLASWESLVQRGVLPDSASPGLQVTLDMDRAARALEEAPLRLQPTPEGLELALVPDARVHDGAFTNNAWLMELPDPVTKVSWGQVAGMSAKTARALQLDDGEIVQLEVGGRTVEAPVLAVPGHADGTVSLALGYGRRGDETIAAGVGTNAYLLRTVEAPWLRPALKVHSTGRREELALTQSHWTLHGRSEEILKHTTLDDYRKEPDFAHQSDVRPYLLYQIKPSAAQQWGMMIDLNACIGCQACTVACQAENNIPVVGKDGVRMGREMHWLRIDRYFHGAPENPQVFNQPMLCQHCEEAPCEYVCPVNATVHSPDGLNEQVYNRCVGTRFCSNNCPYKVRRFNWFDYNNRLSPTETLVKNPDVTVRERGVMEKCTYCVQRIRQQEVKAKVEHRDLDPSSVKTACQQTCPTQAIHFGSKTQKQSEFMEWWHNDRAFSVLHERGTLPRTRYLAVVRNPNPALKEG